MWRYITLSRGSWKLGSREEASTPGKRLCNGSGPLAYACEMAAMLEIKVVYRRKCRCSKHSPLLARVKKQGRCPRNSWVAFSRAISLSWPGPRCGHFCREDRMGFLHGKCSVLTTCFDSNILY